MKPVNRFVAWICLISTTFMGCYTTTLVELSGDGRPDLVSREINYVVMKDGTKYIFDEPPTVQKESIIGVARIKQSDGGYRNEQVSLPISDAAEMSVSEPYSAVSYVAIVGVPLILVGLAIVALYTAPKDFGAN